MIENNQDNPSLRRPAEPKNHAAGGAEPIDRLAAYRGNLAAAERTAGKEVSIGGALVPMAAGMFAVLMAIFLPHSGKVFGFDVLFYTPRAEDFDTTMPERVYAWLAITGGILLVIGTIVSRSWLVAWVNWAAAGIGWWYSIFAVWMCQTRPVTSAGDGPSYGLYLGVAGMTIVFATMSAVLFKRSPLQRALARARREEAHKDEESRMAQQRLRTGLREREQATDIVDDRRQRARARRRAATTGDSGTEATTEKDSSNNTGEDSAEN